MKDNQNGKWNNYLRLSAWTVLWIESFYHLKREKNDPIENTALLTLVDLWTIEPTGMKLRGFHWRFFKLKPVTSEANQKKGGANEK